MCVCVCVCVCEIMLRHCAIALRGNCEESGVDVENGNEVLKNKIILQIDDGISFPHRCCSRTRAHTNREREEKKVRATVFNASCLFLTEIDASNISPDITRSMIYRPSLRQVRREEQSSESPISLSPASRVRM